MTEEFDVKTMFGTYKCYADIIPNKHHIQLYEESEVPYATATVQIPDLRPGEVAIKNYSENEGILDALINAGIVSEPVRYTVSGYAAIPVCNLLRDSN